MFWWSKSETFFWKPLTCPGIKDTRTIFYENQCNRHCSHFYIFPRWLLFECTERGTIFFTQTLWFINWPPGFFRLLLTLSTCQAKAILYPAIIYPSPLTLQLGLGDFPAGLGGRDGGGAGRVHERPFQYARPVLLACGQIALSPHLEFVLAFTCSTARDETLD